MGPAGDDGDGVDAVRHPGGAGQSVGSAPRQPQDAEAHDAHRVRERSHVVRPCHEPLPVLHWRQADTPSVWGDDPDRGDGGRHHPRTSS